jgi:hypothetical protein
MSEDKRGTGDPQGDPSAAADELSARAQDEYKFLGVRWRRGNPLLTLAVCIGSTGNRGDCAPASAVTGRAVVRWIVGTTEGGSTNQREGSASTLCAQLRACMLAFVCARMGAPHAHSGFVGWRRAQVDVPIRAVQRLPCVAHENAARAAFVCAMRLSAGRGMLTVGPCIRHASQ